MAGHVVLLPPNTSIETHVSINAGWPQRLIISGLAGSEGQIAVWQGVGERVVPDGPTKGTRIFTSPPDGIVLLSIHHDDGGWKPNQIRIRSDFTVVSPWSFDPSRLAKSPFSFRFPKMQFSTSLESEDGKDGDFNDVVVSFAWQGEIFECRPEVRRLSHGGTSTRNFKELARLHSRAACTQASYYGAMATLSNGSDLDLPRPFSSVDPLKFRVIAPGGDVLINAKGSGGLGTYEACVVLMG